MKLHKVIYITLLISCINPVLIEAQVNLPELTGEYGVGVTQLPLIDSSRLETFTDTIPDDYREVMVQIWYPTDKGAYGDTIEYHDSITETFYVEQDSFPAGFFNQIKTHALKNHPVVTGNDRFPAILFSPGLGCIYNHYQAFIEDVVSHGYIVVGMNHPYFAFITSFPDGHSMKYGFDTLDNPAEKFYTVVDDAVFVKNELVKINAAGSPHLLSERMDLENMGMYGHSFGGCAAIEMGIKLSEVKAAMNIDGTMFGTGHQNDINIPVYIILNELHTTDLTIDTTWSNLTGDGYKTKINGTKHLNFMDYTLYSKNVLPGRYLEQIGTIDSTRLITFTLKSIIAFFDSYLKGAPIDNVIDVAAPYSEVFLELHENMEIINPFAINNNRAILSQNYPNPFQYITTISFNLPKNQKSVLVIYNYQGRQVGCYNVTNRNSFIWKVKEYPSGSYIYRINTLDYSESKVMVLQR
ncbi:T9SS type A sorting domain-containing protein [Fibrobacterota bacterium]